MKKVLHALCLVGLVGLSGGHGLCAVATAPSDSAPTLDLKRAAEDAEVIIVGELPKEMHLINILLEERKDVAGYSIKASRFIKGSPSVRLTSQAVDIIAGDLTPEAWKRLVIPEKTDGAVSYIYFLSEQRASYDSYPRQKPISPTRWFLPATPKNIRLVEQALPRPKEWGRESGGLVLGVRTLKQVYTSGEPVGIELYVKNVSNHAILFPQQRLAARDCYPFLEFNGGTGVGRSLWVAFLFKPIGNLQADAMPPVNLAPGEIHMERINLDSWQWTSTDGTAPFRAGRGLEMHGFLNVKEFSSEFRYTVDEMREMWKGELNVPEFIIGVKPLGQATVSN